MPQTSELIDFRRAFVWLLCGMLLPSVALVAFGVVAVTNERAAVERRLSEDYQARLRLVQHDLEARLDRAAEAVASGAADPLVSQVAPLQGPPPEPALAEAQQRAAVLPPGGYAFAGLELQGERAAYAVVRPALPADGTLLAQFDLNAVAAEVPRLVRQRFAREYGNFRLIPREPVAPSFAALRRFVSEAGGIGTIVARVPLGAPLEGFTLAAELPGDDPAAAVAFRNRTLYIALLVLLYVGIGVGFGLTLREIRRAYKLSRLKTDFVANISHELRTPLTSVRLFAETLRAGRAGSPEEIHECVDLLATEAERLSKLVEKLLDWSRLESGRRMLELSRTDVSGLLAEIGEAYKAQQLPATYQTEMEPDLPALNVDRDAMAQVVLNLLHNAVKYTGNDKRIRVRARRSGKGVAIEVEDNGPGVRPQDRKRIFERFYRGDDLLSRSTEGTGLGLAISKKIVEAHGGRIELDSRIGEGSTFRIVLPAA